MIRPAVPVLLREGPFVRYLTAVTVSAVGKYASVVALSFGVLGSAGATDLALVLLAREIPLAVLLIIGGVVGDRFPRRWLLVTTNVIQACGQVGVAVSLATDGGRVPLLVCAAVSGAASAFSRPAAAGLLPHVVAAERLQAANALLGMTPRIIGVAGAAIGAGLVELIGAPWALALDAAAFLISAILISTLPRGAPPTRERARGALADVGEGWQEVRARTWLWTMILSFGPFQVCYFPVLFVLGPTLCREHLGGAGAWAVLVSAGLLGGILGGAVSIHLPTRRPLVTMCLAVLGSVAELSALAAGWPLGVVAVCSTAAGAGLAVSDTMWSTTLQRLVPDRALSRVSSFDSLGSVLLNPLGYALVAPVAAVLGDRQTVTITVVALAAATIAPLAVPAVRTLTLGAPDERGAEVSVSPVAAPSPTSADVRSAAAHPSR